LINKWYKLTAFISGVVLIVALFYRTQVIPNIYVISISAGILLYSIVEWSQYEARTAIQDVGFGGIRSWKWHEKTWTIWDVILKIIAVLLVIIPLLKLVLGFP
jgi:hypothetical protein